MIVSVGICDQGEKNMPNLNDYHAYKSTSSEGGTSGNGFGCSPGIIFIIILIIILILIGKT